MADRSQDARRLVLVTGAPRSGTTVIGEHLCKGTGAVELFEPMNLPIADVCVSHWFEMVGADGFGEDRLEDFVARIRSARVRPRRRPGAALRHRLLNRAQRTALRLRITRRSAPIVWKDPFALLLAPQLVGRCNVPVVVTIRDPLSLAASFKRMAWSAPAADLAERMVRAGVELDADVLAAARAETAPARAGAALWALLYPPVTRWLDAGVAITPVLMSDLIEAPDDVTRLLRDRTGLAIAPIEKPSDEASDDPLPQKAHIKKRNADSIVNYWSKILDDDEIAFCRGLTDDRWAALRAASRRALEAI